MLAQVGSICCRLENKDGKQLLYLMTMGILAVRFQFVAPFFTQVLIQFTAIPLKKLGYPNLGINLCHSLQVKDRQDILTCAGIQSGR